MNSATITVNQFNSLPEINQHNYEEYEFKQVRTGPGRYMQIPISYKKKINRTELIKDILAKDVISREEYELLNGTQKRIYTLYHEIPERDGMYGVTIVPVDYIKRTVKALLNANAERELNIMRNNILRRETISREDFRKLRTDQQNLYTVKSERTYQNGMPGTSQFHIEPVNYIRKNIKARLNTNTESELNRVRENIIKKNTINPREYNKLKKNQKELYELNEIEWVKTGIQEHTEVPKFYLKKGIRARLNSLRQRKLETERESILKKTSISSTEYFKLSEDQKSLYEGDTTGLTGRKLYESQFGDFNKYIKK